MGGIDELAVRAGSDPRALEQLIGQHEFFILKCASNFTKRYITKSDDEWSVGLLAFSQAVQSYTPEKGAFLSFAELVIRRRLTDYVRTESRHKVEILAGPEVFEGGSPEDSAQPALQAQVLPRLVTPQESGIKQEIEAANFAFSAYGFSFFDLASCSPHAQKTKKSCAKAAAALLNEPELMGQMRASKQLPLKIIEENSGVPRKILERHRKYIIAAIEILSGDYPGLAEYMRFIREEVKR